MRSQPDSMIDLLDKLGETRIKRLIEAEKARLANV